MTPALPRRYHAGGRKHLLYVKRRGGRGRVVGVVEQELATPEQLAIGERNSGVCAFDAAWLWPRLDALPLSGKGEYLLTDLVGAAVAEGERDGRWPVAAVGVEDATEAMGVNTRAQLADAEAVLRGRILEDLMRSGVSVQDPASTYVDAGVQVGRDSSLLPGTFLSGGTVVGEGCEIGPHASIDSSRIGDGCRVRWSLVEGSVLEEGADAGPYAHIRAGSRIGRGAHVGSYVETKATAIGARSSVAHLSYVGDTEIGEGVNIGAGTINANYDHATGRKHRSVVRDGAALGSDTVLVAPVEVGEGARTGAGAVVTRDVPPHRTAVGVPARVLPPRGDESAELAVGASGGGTSGDGVVEGGTAPRSGEGD